MSTQTSTKSNMSTKITPKSKQVTKLYYLIHSQGGTFVPAISKSKEELVSLRGEIIRFLQEEFDHNDKDDVESCLEIVEHDVGSLLDIFDIYQIDTNSYSSRSSNWMASFTHIMYGIDTNLEEYSKLYNERYLWELCEGTFD